MRDEVQDVYVNVSGMHASTDDEKLQEVNCLITWGHKVQEI